MLPISNKHRRMSNHPGWKFHNLPHRFLIRMPQKRLVVVALVEVEETVQAKQKKGPYSRVSR